MTTLRYTGALKRRLRTGVVQVSNPAVRRQAGVILEFEARLGYTGEFQARQKRGVGGGAVGTGGDEERQKPTLLLSESHFPDRQIKVFYRPLIERTLKCSGSLRLGKV